MAAQWWWWGNENRDPHLSAFVRSVGVQNFPTCSLGCVSVSVCFMFNVFAMMRTRGVHRALREGKIVTISPASM